MSLPGDRRHIDAGQQHLPGMGPAVGERYRNVNTGTICSVVGLANRRQGWVTVRINGTVQTIRLDTFERFFIHA